LLKSVWACTESKSSKYSEKPRANMRMAHTMMPYSKGGSLRLPLGTRIELRARAR
jgi:hypothetical protein